MYAQDSKFFSTYVECLERAQWVISFPEGLLSFNFVESYI